MPAGQKPEETDFGPMSLLSGPDAKKFGEKRTGWIHCEDEKRGTGRNIPAEKPVSSLPDKKIFPPESKEFHAFSGRIAPRSGIFVKWRIRQGEKGLNDATKIPDFVNNW